MESPWERELGHPWTAGVKLRCETAGKKSPSPLSLKDSNSASRGWPWLGRGAHQALSSWESTAASGNNVYTDLSLVGNVLGGTSRWKISSMLSCITEKGILETKLPSGCTRDLN